MLTTKYKLPVLALMTLMALPLAAQADTQLPSSQTGEWAGIRQILSVMGKGTLSPADQRSMLDILDTKGSVEDGKVSAPATFPTTPVSPVGVKKQPPHRSPSAF